MLGDDIMLSPLNQASPSGNFKEISAGRRDSRQRRGKKNESPVPGNDEGRGGGRGEELEEGPPSGKNLDIIV
jgi:hypothetical protein